MILLDGVVGVLGRFVTDVEIGGCVGNGYCNTPLTGCTDAEILFDIFALDIFGVTTTGDGDGLLYGDCGCGLFIGDTAFKRGSA